MTTAELKTALKSIYEGGELSKIVDYLPLNELGVQVATINLSNVDEIKEELEKYASEEDSALIPLICKVESGDLFKALILFMASKGA